MSNSAKRHLPALQLRDSWRRLDAVMLEENYSLKPSPLCAVIKVCKNLWSTASLYVRKMWGVLFSDLTGSYYPFFLELSLSETVGFPLLFKLFSPTQPLGGSLNLG